MSNPVRRREVTADSMTRVAAVVATLVEASAAAPASAEVPLTDLIAKAAQEVEQHASASRILRTRGVALHKQAGESLKAAPGGASAAAGKKLDVVR